MVGRTGLKCISHQYRTLRPPSSAILRRSLLWIPTTVDRVIRTKMDFNISEFCSGSIFGIAPRPTRSDSARPSQEMRL